MSTNGRPAALRFTVIPMSSCRRCSLPARPEGMRYGIPIAQAGPPDDRAIRYVCGDCRAAWDVFWNVTALAGFFPTYGAFSDTFIGV